MGALDRADRQSGTSRVAAVAAVLGAVVVAAHAQGMLDGVPDSPGLRKVPPSSSAPPSPVQAQPAPAPPGASPQVAPPLGASPSTASTPGSAAPASPPPTIAIAPPPVSTPPGAPAGQPSPAPGPATGTPPSAAAPGTPPAPAAQAPAAPPAAQAPSAASTTPASPPPKGMLDDIESQPGVITIIPGLQQPAQQPLHPPVAGPPPPAPSPAAPPVADIIRSALAAGVFMTPPTTGPVAVAIEEIARQCQKPVADVQQAIRALSRTPTLSKQPIASLDNKEKGSVFAISVAPPAKPSDVMSCIAPAQPLPALRLDLLEKAREFGPMDGPRIDAAKQAQLVKDLNASFGDPANPWRLATAEELLAIVPVLLAENLWGPDGGMFWTSNPIAGGGRLGIETKTEKQGYRATPVVVDNTAKATPIWVRSGK